MFTEATTHLRDALSDYPATVVRDCRFAYVGKVRSHITPRLVPCATAAHLHMAVAQTGIVGVIVPSALANDVPQNLGLGVADNPVKVAWAIHADLCARDFHWAGFATRIAPDAVVHPSAVVAERDVVIGPRSVIHPGAIILPRTIIGADCAVGPGTVVGSDAFEVDTSISPSRIMPQAGGVYLDDHVEIQAKCTIVRATFGGFTRLERETKLDCQIHVAHDCHVGPRTRIAACAEISGRVVIGADVFVGPNCAISNGVCIGDGAQITIGAVVTRDVAAGAKVSGNFAVDHARFLNHVKQIR